MVEQKNSINIYIYINDLIITTTTTTKLQIYRNIDMYYISVLNSFNASCGSVAFATTAFIVLHGYVFCCSKILFFKYE